MAKEFRWNDWNLDHATRHGCTVAEIESVIRNGGRGFPRKMGDEKWLVIGRGAGGRFVHTIYVLDDDDTIYVIHAMPVDRPRRNK